jgi:hypothetical protein
MLLDIVILIGTAEQVAMRFIGALLKSRREAAEVEKEITSPPKEPTPETALPTAVNGSESSVSVVRPLGGRRPRHRHSSTHLTSVGEPADT